MTDLLPHLKTLPMSGLLDDVITRRYNALASFMFISSDLSELSVNGLSGFFCRAGGNQKGK